jgi:pantetheine-phosphate adenylyltransferase
MPKAIYAFSGDPITFGHIDIIDRALQVFKEIIIGIGANPKKEYLFSLDERKAMAENALAKYKNVHIVTFKGLLVDYAYENGIPVVIRGLRNSEDYNYEMMLFQISESQNKGIDTFFIPSRQEYVHISSGAVKAIQIEQGLIHEFVPLYTKQKLEEKLSNQFIIGITGEIGVGKSYVCQKFKDYGKKLGIEVNRIDIDMIGRGIMEVLREPIYQKFRDSIFDTFGKEIKLKKNFIDGKALGKIIFKDINKLKEFNTLIYKPLLLRLRRELYQKKGLILLDSALILESEMAYLCNNNMILVTSDRQTQLQRLEKRKYTDAQMSSRINSQYTISYKKKMIRDQIRRDKQGKVYEIDNSGAGNQQHLKKLFNKIIKDFNIGNILV